MAKRKSDDAKIDTGRWLTTYADMMNNLLVLFMVLYAMSVMDLKKFEALSKSLSATFSGNTQTQAVSGAGDNSAGNIAIPPDADQNEQSEMDQESSQKFDALYEKIKKGVEENGYSDVIDLEKEDAFIKFKFKDSVMFYADSAEMKPTGTQVLAYVGGLLGEVDTYTKNIEIGGHTAQVSEETNHNFFAWELSSNRAISVLKYLVQNCGLPQSKMLITGYSHYDPVGDNSTEDGRSENRRVEIKIIRLSDENQ